MKLHIGHFAKVTRPYYTVFTHTELQLYCNRDPKQFSFVMKKAVNGSINKYCSICYNKAFPITPQEA